MLNRFEMMMATGRISVWLRFTLLGGVIPFCFSFIVYFGFVSNYTVHLFSESKFRSAYEGNIYKYRVLGRVAVLTTYDLLDRYHLAAKPPKALNFYDSENSPTMYTA